MDKWLKLQKVLKDPFQGLLYLLRKCAPLIANDEFYVRCYYYLNLHATLNLNTPRLFTEKLQWLKLHDRNPIYKTVVDKIAVKQYVCRLIGEEYVIPTLRVYDGLSNIDVSALPDKFVLKTTNGGAEVMAW